MFLLRLSSLCSSLRPRGSAPVCRVRAVVRSSWSVQHGLAPPWPPPSPQHLLPQHLLHLLPAAATRTFQLHSHRGIHSGGRLLMERSSDREPPQKRRKSEEERGGGGGGGGSRDRGGGGARTKDRGSKREQNPSVERGRQQNQQNHLRGGGAGGAGGAGGGRGGDRTKPSRDRVPNRRPDQSPPPPAPPPAPPPHRPNPWSRGREEDGRRPGAPWTGRWPGEPPPPGTSSSYSSSADAGRPGKPLHRRWETPPGCSSSSSRPPGGGSSSSSSSSSGGGGFDFSVMSYNILSQALLQDNSYLYRHCDPAVLRWEYRLHNLLTEVERLDADILCLQEVQEDHYQNQIRPALQRLGYQCEYKKRTGSKPDGCAIVFKSSRLSLLSSNPVEFLRPGDALLDRDNVGLVLLLRPNRPNHDRRYAAADPSAASSICVANTHLLYNPRRGDIKLAQLAILLAEIGRLCRRPDGSTNPVVLCGDFNSTPWSPLYRFLTTGRLKYRGLPLSKVSGQEDAPRGQRLLSSPLWSQSLGINHRCQYEDTQPADPPDPPNTADPPDPPSLDPPSTTAVEGAISNLTVDDVATNAAAAFHRAKIEHTLKLHSSYQHVLMHDGRPEITTCHSRTALTVDYILFTPAPPPSPSRRGGRGLQLLSRLSLVGQSELEEVNSLPNQHHSSDHLPLLARFRLHS